MVTIIKNQLLKHLSRYTKNLSPEQISLSALRGSGELADLTLDEDVLTELLELPAWLRLTSAKCNRAAFRIQWTKLKTVPITLNLDEVHIALEVCNEPRPFSSSGGATVPNLGKYSFIHKVIDGISIAINSVQIHFSCDAFNSSVQIMRMTVESRTPTWQKGDLTVTRIKSPDTGHLLIFKEVELQSARVEAISHTAADSLPPLRLLIGPSHTRIVLKKRLSDAQVVGCRLAIQAEPLGLALTDGQLRAAAACAAALAPPARAAARAARRHQATRKLQQVVEPVIASDPVKSGGGNEAEALRRLFNRHDVKETSYHLLAPRIDLHLCDDDGLGRSEKPSLRNGGALQVTLLNLQADYFPFHVANGERRHWRGYREAATPHSQWLSQAIHYFRSEILDLFDPRNTYSSSDKISKQPKEEDSNRIRNNNLPTSPTSRQNSLNNNSEFHNSGTTERTKLLKQLSKLMTTCFVLRIDDFTVYKVCTGSKSREPPKPLVSAESTTMPGDAGLLHAEMTYFYYPGDDCFPVPSPKLYVQLSPVRVNVDVDTFVWLGSFLPHVAKALDVLADLNSSGDTEAENAEAKAELENLLYLDVKCEAIMPKLVLEAGSEHVSQQRDRPKELHVCTARATLSNIREPEHLDAAGTRSDLSETISALQRTAPSRGHFPNYPTEIQEKFLEHAKGLDDINRGTTISPELMWRESRNVWNVRAEPFWVETLGTRPNASKATPLCDATPLSAWLFADSTFTNIWVLARLVSLASVQINHYQLLFLLRQLEKLSDLAAWFAHDSKRLRGEDDGKISVRAVVPQAEVTIILPTAQNSQTDLPTDAESVRPDTSSLNDLKLVSMDQTVAPSVAEASIDSSGGFVFPIMEEIPPAPPSPSFSSAFGGFQSMRKGFTSLVSSIDGALSRDDVTSLASSDDDHYVVMGLADTPDEYDKTFRDFELGRPTGGNIEVAAEVIEESNSTSDSVRSVSSAGMRRDMVSTCTFRVNGIQLSHEAHSGTSRLAFTADAIDVSECPSIPWDEFQCKFSMRSRGWKDPTLENAMSRVIPHKIAACLERKELPSNPCCPPPSTLSSYEELLEARVRELNIELHVSTALALAEFIQDEVVQPPLPLKVELNDVNLTMVEDRASRDISAPPQPLKIQLDCLRLMRDSQGTLTILPAMQILPQNPAQVNEAASEAAKQELAAARSDLARLERENDLLKRRLAEHSRQMHTIREESSLLKNVAHAAQQETAALLADKHVLLDTVRSLQGQLSNTFLNRNSKR